MKFVEVAEVVRLRVAGGPHGNRLWYHSAFCFDVTSHGWNGRWAPHTVHLATCGALRCTYMVVGTTCMHACHSCHSPHGIKTLLIVPVDRHSWTTWPGAYILAASMALQRRRRFVSFKR